MYKILNLHNIRMYVYMHNSSPSCSTLSSTLLLTSASSVWGSGVHTNLPHCQLLNLHYTSFFSPNTSHVCSATFATALHTVRALQPQWCQRGLDKQVAADLHNSINSLDINLRLLLESLHCGSAISSDCMSSFHPCTGSHITQAAHLSPILINNSAIAW